MSDMEILEKFSIKMQRLCSKSINIKNYINKQKTSVLIDVEER